jgi:hypothetical protein
LITVENAAVGLRISEDGSDVSILDRRRGCVWRLDARHATFGRYAEGGVAPLRETLSGAVAKQDGSRIEVIYALPDGEIRYSWQLGEDYVEVILRAKSGKVEFVSMPGAFVPADGTRELAIPMYQGALVRASGTRWERTVRPSAHGGFSLAMAAVIGDKGALLQTHETVGNWQGTFGEEVDGPFLFFEERRCPVDGWGERALRLYPVNRDLTAICKRYRARVIERSDFVSWGEKIARKPIIKELFGALIAFLGYNKADEIDYVASAKKLKSHGFDSIFYYSTRMCHYSLNFKMGGDDPIWLSDEEIAGIRAIPGSHIAPWVWVVEGLDDGSEAMRGIFSEGAGGFVPNWRIDNFQWYMVCTPYQVDHIKRRLATDMKAMDWLHFDVNASRAGAPCVSTRHALHRNRPLSTRDDLEWTRRLFGADTVGNRIVSSEGFVEHYVPYYEIGSTKVVPHLADNAPIVPVPMTMLVYHDSCIHDWWEVHNYNDNPAFPMKDNPNAPGATGAGAPQLKASLDALYGCPPNLFPFGRQYGWTDAQKRVSFSFLVRLEDASVQEAIRAALPVARLHKRIGMCALEAFEFLSEDRTVQTTTFADGTRIVANLSGKDQAIDKFGMIPAQSWRETRE